MNCIFNQSCSFGLPANPVGLLFGQYGDSSPPTFGFVVALASLLYNYRVYYQTWHLIIIVACCRMLLDIIIL